MSVAESVAGEEAFDPFKVTLLPGATEDAATFAIQDEDHTLGNSLRYVIMKNPQVEFCGYSAPHPSEPKIHLRIQTYDHHSAVSALFKGLQDLEDLVRTVKDRYEKEVQKGGYPVEEEKTVKQRLDELIETKYPHLRADAAMAEA